VTTTALLDWLQAGEAQYQPHQGQLHPARLQQQLLGVQCSNRSQLQQLLAGLSQSASTWNSSGGLSSSIRHKQRAAAGQPLATCYRAYIHGDTGGTTLTVVDLSPLTSDAWEEWTAQQLGSSLRSTSNSNSNSSSLQRSGRSDSPERVKQQAAANGHLGDLARLLTFLAQRQQQLPGERCRCKGVRVLIKCTHIVLQMLHCADNACGLHVGSCTAQH
jgi:hypothetical protein